MDIQAKADPAATLSPATLRTGDILLMLGEGPLSDLIAWASDGPYSHAAIVADGGDLIEASTVGVRRYPLEQRFADQAHYHYIDAFRPHGAAAAPLDDADLGAVLAQAQTMLGIPYPVDQLALLGAIMAVRGKWPVHEWARLVVRVAFDHLLKVSPDRMVCSEVVYRAFAECDVTPVRRLALPIVVGERNPTPFPDIDWKALYEEMLPLLKPKGTLQAASSPQVAALHAMAAPALMAGEAPAASIADEELEQARQDVLAMLAPRPVMDGLLGAESEPVDPLPNPRLVSPQDLAISPGVSALGRLMQRAAA